MLHAKLKAVQASHGGLFVVEDTLLYFDCLNGLPGPLIKWFMKTIGNEGLCKIIEPFQNYRAATKTAVGYISESGEEHFFEGVLEGTIVTPRGDGGLGFDPIFQPEGFTKTMAELTLWCRAIA